MKQVSAQIVELESGIDYKEINERKTPYEIKRKLAETIGLFCTIFLVGFYYLCAIGLFLVLVNPLMR